LRAILERVRADGCTDIRVEDFRHQRFWDERGRSDGKTKESMNPFDWTIVAIYSASIVGIGIAASFMRRKKERGGEDGHYFLAGNTLAWPVIGLAMFAANISTVHLVNLAEAAYRFGLVFGNFEGIAGFTLILLSLFFAPLYLRSRVATLPDFLERRFNRGCRDIFSIVSLCAQADTVAHTCVFVLSEKARFITGHIMHVSGGAELGYRRILS
jgi:uncharacterized sodium:solute symporter family permease YidK